MPGRGPKPKIDQRAKRKKLGMGEGYYADYTPYLRAQDLGSEGFSYRTKGWRTPRMYTFFSSLEFAFFLILQWLEIVLDIREQIDLDLNETLEIAANNGLHHPIKQLIENRRKIGQIYIPVTLDFRITIIDNFIHKEIARDVKPRSELTTRTLKKLEITRIYHANRNIPYGIVTETMINWVLAKNLFRVCDNYYWEDFLPFALADSSEIIKYLTQKVFLKNVTISNAGKAADERFSLEEGNGVSICHYLIARKMWKINMEVPWHPQEPLPFLLAPNEIL
jgi:hypothetical protein